MERRCIAVRGVVQGVGFRPYVYRLASSLKLGGFVRNQSGGVTIEVEGDERSLETFLDRLVSKPPPLAHISDWSSECCPTRGERGFHIEHSRPDVTGAIVVTPDAATCDACLAELFDPRDRRYRYPFLNCTNCGPRLTIVTGVPYDRRQTTMAGFAMCPRCREEYDDPSNRRFHAQPTACADCGPKLKITDGHGERIETNDPLACFVNAIRAGKIGAMKGLGGYHLACDARSAAAAAELRRRKHRYEKPFAVMVRDVAAAQALCEAGSEEQALLNSIYRPIVLLPKRVGCRVAAEVAPGNPFLGVMLPYTPVHHLLLHALGDMPLVMTSGNRSDEPIAFDERDVFEKLAGIADVYLTHDRPIHVRCDDSVTRVVGGQESPIRRSRGHAPQPVPIPVLCRGPILAVGGQLKNTFALGSDRRAVLSHHMGDLDHFEAYRAFEKDIALYEELFSLRPRCVAHDLHPDYASTRYAMKREAEGRVARMPVQHHHAHMASCMAEHGLTGQVIGVTLDGSGFGTDRAIWGGEFLVGGYERFERSAHLRYVRMPGAEQAVREPWRMAAAHLLDAGATCPPFARRQQTSSLSAVGRMIERGFNSPITSSAGRLFDAVASLAGIRDRVSFEGQAAMELEWQAALVPAKGAYPFELSDPAIVIDTRPLISAVAADAAAGVAPGIIARRFHSTLVEIVASVCERIRRSTGLTRVVFSGGVFMNALFSVEARDRLTRDGFQVYRHRVVPPNDGGLSLGQVAIAASLLSSSGAPGVGER